MPSLWQPVFVTLAAVATLYYSGKFPAVLRKINEIGHGKAGCMPVGDLGNVTLHYFNLRGRGEAIRLMLAEAQVPYKEVNFDKYTWPEHKKKGTESGLFTFGQVPAMETESGVQLAQSQAVLHYIGRATGMDCDCDDMHFCEVLAQGVEDVRRQYGTMIYNPDFSLKDRNDYLSDYLPLWLGYFERIAPPLTKQKDAYFASDRLTWVDFLIFDLLDVNMEFSQYDLGNSATKVNVLSALPKLNNFYTQMKDRPRIATYLRSNRRFPYHLPYTPKAS